jgi:hypothetical protein
MKVPVIYNHDYTVFFEHYQGATYIHCECAKWDKRIKSQLKKDFDALAKIHRNNIYALHELGDKKHEKFLAIFGFGFYKEFIGANEKRMCIYVRRT